MAHAWDQIMDMSSLVFHALASTRYRWWGYSSQPAGPGMRLGHWMAGSMGAIRLGGGGGEWVLFLRGMGFVGKVLCSERRRRWCGGWKAPPALGD